MFKRLTIIACAGLALACTVGADAYAAKRSAHSAEYRKTEHLIRLMDKDKNGEVSKAEFMSLMSAEFDRLDVNKNGTLSARELSRTRLTGGSPTHREVLDLLRLMDRNRSGAVEKDEYIQFVSEEFDRIDADKSGTVTREELSQSIFVHPQQKHVGGTGK